MAGRLIDTTWCRLGWSGRRGQRLAARVGRWPLPGRGTAGCSFKCYRRGGSLCQQAHSWPGRPGAGGRSRLFPGLKTFATGLGGWQSRFAPRRWRWKHGSLCPASPSLPGFAARRPHPGHSWFGRWRWKHGSLRPASPSPPGLAVRRPHPGRFWFDRVSLRWPFSPGRRLFQGRLAGGRQMRSRFRRRSGRNRKPANRPCWRWRYWRRWPGRFLAGCGRRFIWQVTKTYPSQRPRSRRLAGRPGRLWPRRWLRHRFCRRLFPAWRRPGRWLWRHRARRLAGRWLAFRRRWLACFIGPLDRFARRPEAYPSQLPGCGLAGGRGDSRPRPGCRPGRWFLFVGWDGRRLDDKSGRFLRSGRHWRSCALLNSLQPMARRAWPYPFQPVGRWTSRGVLLRFCSG